MLCCGYTLTDFPISIRLTSLALWQPNDCPSASKATLMNMDKYLKCEFIMNDCITTTKQSTTKPCAYFLGYTVWIQWVGVDFADRHVNIRNCFTFLIFWVLCLLFSPLRECFHTSHNYVVQNLRSILPWPFLSDSDTGCTIPDSTRHVHMPVVLDFQIELFYPIIHL